MCRSGLLRTVEIGTSIWRLRSHFGDQALLAPDQFTSPPIEHATQPNRMSPAGIPMFYGAEDFETAMLELLDVDHANANDEDHVSGAQFRNIVPLYILDLTCIPSPPSYFASCDPTRRHLLVFLKEFAADVARPIRRDKRQYIDYVPTQVFTEFVRHVMNGPQGQSIHGIRYASSRNGKPCWVIFAKQNDCLPSNLLSVSKEPILEFIPTSIRRTQMHTATIKLFLVHGDPQRLRIAQMANWNGNAIAGPRTDLHHLFGRDESRLAGVYLLAGTDPRSGKFTVLIGTDSSVRDGIKRHLGQDFWNSAIIVTASDRNLTMPELAYLEAELILAAKVAERAQVLHDVAQHVELREPDKGVMEDFLVRVQQILPVLGTDLLVPLRREIGIANQPILVCTATGISARGVEQPRGFVVLKGSQAALDEQPLDKQVENARRLRARLLEQGVLERGNGFLQFTQDHEFTSHTEAALVVLGANVDGACAWTTEGGHTLQQIEVERVWDLP